MFVFFILFFSTVLKMIRVASSVVVAAVRVGPFREIVRAICDHVFVGCQWFAIAVAKGSSWFSASVMSCGVSGYVIRLIFTCFCWAVVFVLNVAVSRQ